MVTQKSGVYLKFFLDKIWESPYLGPEMHMSLKPDVT